MGSSISIQPVRPTWRRVLRPFDWPVRAKMAALLVLVSLLPLAVTAVGDIRQMRRQLVEGTQALLSARADELGGKLDAFNASYRLLVDKVARVPGATALCQASGDQRTGLQPPFLAMVGVARAAEPAIRDIGLLDPAGRVHTATDPALVGLDLSGQPAVRAALLGSPAISDLELPPLEVGTEPTITYLAPVRDADGRQVGVAALWVRAAALWAIARTSDGLAGPGSFAVLFDHLGIRIAHSSSTVLVFRPGGTLEPAVIAEQVAERRFGPRTRELLEDVRPFPEPFRRARAASPETGVFQELAPVNGLLNYAVSRRLASTSWTLFSMIPTDAVEAPITSLTRIRVLTAGLIMLLAFVVGMLVSAAILRPVAALRHATRRLTEGDLAARVAPGAADEFGQLAQRFNAMAARMEAQAAAVRQAHEVLEQRVAERTAELQRAAGELTAEVVVRRAAEERLQAQLTRLDLLGRIARAIGERQDLESIFQVVVRSIEDHLPLDFSCACLYDEPAGALTVTSVGVRSADLVQELAMPVKAVIPIDRNGLSRCVAGQLVHEPDLTGVAFPFPRRLVGGGLHALVACPLRVEGRTFGVLLAARRRADSFSSGECEFLRQLSELVALAAHQARLHASLERAYDDLRQTQQAVMQQERLRVLGQMASGIAHDINNAISPVMLYTESLLARETGLSQRARTQLETVQRAVEDVAHTVGRMREFYRQGDAQAAMQAVDLNQLVPQVIDLARVRWSDMAQQRGVTIAVANELAPGLPPVLGVPSEIREALINLVFNAVDAMPDGGSLTLRTGCDGGTEGNGRIHVEVVDSGAGMDEETRRRCLEPFFTTKGERGTGLGLAMVYGVMQRHLGEIAIETAPGRGTTMRLSFPRVAAPAVEPPAPPAPHVARRLLVVDDDPILLRSLDDALSAEGHTVVTANHGRTGIELFRAAVAAGRPHDLVLTDLGMPEVDGRQVARAVKEASPSTPVIMLTGWGQRLVAEGDVPPHVDCVLGKPPKMAELRVTLARLRPG